MSSALIPGARLGPYEVLSAIGTGGMGAVYRARDTRLDRQVALKVLLAGAGADEQVRQRFEREARAISSLNHPNICVLHDVGRERPSGADDGPVDFLVMEYLEGETLADRLGRGPLHLDDAVNIAIQIASALDRAHGQGIVHRDLKPGNVMLARGPAVSPRDTGTHVKLLDFGLARLAQTDAATIDGQGLVAMADLATANAPLTVEGTVLGTLQYMSPEQIAGKPVDARADIFAFGALLYEMISGQRPFDGSSQASVIGAILDREPPPLRTVRPETPLLLEELVSRALAKDREARWQSSRDLLRLLEWIAAHAMRVPAPVDESGGRSGTRARWIRTASIVVVASVVSGGAAAWALWPHALPPPPVSRFAVALPEGQVFTRTGRRVVALSPDGSALVYVANRQLYLRNLGELTAAPIAGTENTDPSEPVFSPDGQWVAFWSGGSIKKIRVGGGTPVVLSAAENPSGMSWQEDRILAAQESVPAIVEVPAGGGKAVSLVHLDAAKQERAQSPQLVGEGRAVLFTLSSGGRGWDVSDIIVQDLASGRRTVLFTGGTDARVAPGGHLIYMHDGSLYALGFNDGTLTVSGAPRIVQADVEIASGGFSGTGQMALSRSGTLAFVPARFTRNNRLIWIDRRGEVEPSPLPERQYHSGAAQMRISPDGTRVAMTVLADASGGDPSAGQDIWLWDIARAAFTRLSFTSHAASPVWTPDNRRVCFNSASDVICQPADGLGKSELMFRVNGLIDLSQVSPDGKWLIMDVRSSAGDDISIAPLQPGAQVRPLIASGATDERPSISPDGRWIAYESNESGPNQVYVRPFPDVNEGRWQISTRGGGKPHWSRDGRELFFLDIATGGASAARAVMSMPVPAGERFAPAAPKELMKLPAGSSLGYAEGADGRFLFIVRATSTDDASASSPQIVVVENWAEELKRLLSSK